MEMYHLHRLEGMFHPYAVSVHRNIVISIDHKPTAWAFVGSIREGLFHDFSEI